MFFFRPGFSLFFISLFICLKSSGTNPDTTDIYIFHVNDMHAKIENFSSFIPLVNSYREKEDNVFVVSAGDMFSGNPFVDQHPKKGSPIIDLMNKARFNVTSVGNHEFDYGQKTLSERIEQATFDFICANINTAGTGLKPFAPYKIIKTKNKIKLAFIGLIHRGENNIPESHPSKVDGLKFDNPFESIKKHIEIKKDSTILIVLSHLGYDNDLKLAAENPKIDVIIGGHSHTILKNKKDTVSKPYIVHAGANMVHSGLLKLRFTNGKIISRTDSLIILSSLPKNSEIEDEIKKYSNNPELNQAICDLPMPIKGINNLGALMADALRINLKTDFAFQNFGGVRSDSLNNGKIAKSDVFRLDPFGNEVVLIAMTGKEIETLLVNAYNKKNEPDLQISGGKYNILIGTDKKAIGASISDENGKPIDPLKKYKVAINSYIAKNYKYSCSDNGVLGTKTTTENLIEFFRQNKNYNYSGVQRISISESK